MLESKLSGWKEKELSVICITVMVKRKGREKECTDRVSVRDE